MNFFDGDIIGILSLVIFDLISFDFFVMMGFNLSIEC